MAEQFEQLVFSGGGLRCFWQGGFLEEARDAFSLDPERVTGVSGGSVSGAAFLAHRGEQLLETMCHAFAPLESNIQFDDLDEEEGLTPHQRVFNEVLSDVFDKDAMRKIGGGPSFQVLVAHPPTRRLAGLSGSAMTLVYESELHIVNSPHFSWAEKLGLTSELVNATAVAKDGKLVDLMMAAVTIPPIFRTRKWNGQPVVDGGMADQAPMPDPDRGRSLILLTRPYREIPDRADRVYVAPTGDLPADKLDFTDPDNLRRTWDHGRRDGQRFLSEHL